MHITHYTIYYNRLDRHCHHHFFVISSHGNMRYRDMLKVNLICQTLQCKCRVQPKVNIKRLLSFDCALYNLHQLFMDNESLPCTVEELIKR